MDDLEQFLRARLDEDEQTARAHRQASARWYYDHMAHEVRDEDNAGTVAFTHDGDGQHIARHDPARALREVEAKRRILELYVARARLAQGDDDADYENIQEDAYLLVLRHLALSYADHPDYRDEWRP